MKLKSLVFTLCFGISAVQAGFLAAEQDNATSTNTQDASNASSEWEREQYLIKQGSTRSQKFSVHESAQPKSHRSVIVDSENSKKKTNLIRSKNGPDTVTYGGSFRQSSSSVGRGLSYTEREMAKDNARNRYYEAKKSGRIPAKDDDLAGEDYKADLEKLLENLKKTEKTHERNHK